MARTYMNKANEIRAMVKKGHSNTEVAAIVGVTPSYVSQLRTTPKQKQLAKRARIIKNAICEGMTNAEIATLTGEKPNTIAMQRAKLGLTHKAMRAKVTATMTPAKTTRKTERAQVVQRMITLNTDTRTTANATGVSESAVGYHRKKMGLTGASLAKTFLNKK